MSTTTEAAGLHAGAPDYESFTHEPMEEALEIGDAVKDVNRQQKAGLAAGNVTLMDSFSLGFSFAGAGRAEGAVDSLAMPETAFSSSMARAGS